MTFTLFQIIMVAVPAVVGAFAMAMVVLASADDACMEASTRFALPFTLGVWVVCTVWAFWPMVMG